MSRKTTRLIDLVSICSVLLVTCGPAIAPAATPTPIAIVPQATATAGGSRQKP